ncbi:MAG: bacteriocin [Bacteroidia bacterium]|nr:bacteriocin [Bacteroidia bacterium]
MQSLANFSDSRQVLNTNELNNVVGGKKEKTEIDGHKDVVKTVRGEVKWVKVYA